MVGTGKIVEDDGLIVSPALSAAKCGERGFDGSMKNVEDVPLLGEQLRNIFDVFVGGGCRHHPIYKYGANHNASSSTISRVAREARVAGVARETTSHNALFYIKYTLHNALFYIKMGFGEHFSDMKYQSVNRLVGYNDSGG